MIWHSFETILASFVSAAVYGAVFAFLSILIKCFIRIFNLSFRVVSDAFFYKTGVFDTACITKGYTGENKDRIILSEVTRALSVILFFSGFMILSYYILDGEFRIFMFAGALITALITFGSPGVVLERFIMRCALRVFCVFLIALRIVFYPLRKIFGYFYRKIEKNTPIKSFLSTISYNITLDSIKK